jgi:acetyl esterase/lipase
MIRLAYGPHQTQFGDLRLPAGKGPHPVAVVIHGGFWRAAFDLENIAPLCEALTAAGIATWNLEYRRVGNGGGWPVTFEDVSLGAQFVAELAVIYPVDPARIIAVGHSAGGHLALMLSSQVRGVVSLAGVADVRRAWELGLGRGAAAEFLGGSPDEVPEYYQKASPMELLPAGVPVRLIHGSRDEIVPPEISERYARAASAAGDDVEVISLEGAGHNEVRDPQSAQWPEVLSQIERISAMV